MRQHRATYLLSLLVCTAAHCTACAGALRVVGCVLAVCVAERERVFVQVWSFAYRSGGRESVDQSRRVFDNCCEVPVEQKRREQSRAEMKVSGQEIRAPAGRAGQGWDGMGWAHPHSDAPKPFVA